MSASTVLLFSVVIIQGLLEEGAAEGIPKVNANHLHILDPFGFTIAWSPIEYNNDTDPIIGIKIKVWRTPCKIKTIRLHSGGQVTEIVKSERLKFNDSTIPQELPESVHIVTPEVLNHTVAHVDPEVWYHVRVLAFTATAEGPHSSPTQFKINTGDENDKMKSCERIISQSLVKDEDYV